MGKKGKAKAGGAKKARAEFQFQRAYEGGRHQRRLANWYPSRASINQMLSADGHLLRARSRDLCRNNGYAFSARESFVANLVGTGIKPSPLLQDGLRDDVLQAYAEWTDEADIDGLTDLYGLQALVAGEMFEAGEAFIRFREQPLDSGLSVPLQLQILQSEMCPLEKNETAANGNSIINGVEFDGDDPNRRVAYWFWTVYPGDPRFRRLPEMQVRVPADEVLHIFRPLHAGQVRGQPWTTAAIVKLYLQDSYDDAELDRKRTAAMYTGFIKTPTPEAFKSAFDAEPDGNGPELPDDPAVQNVTLEPGTMQMLLPGEEVTFSSPAEVGGSYEAFQFRNLLGVSAGMSTPYPAVTGDASKNNYSSMRGIAVEQRRRLEQLQHGCLVFQMCRPIYRRFLDLAVLVGRIEIPGYIFTRSKYQAAKYIAPRFEWVDPLKDLQAEDLAVSAGFKARSTVIESMGEDPEEVDRRIAADKARADRLGLDFTARPAPVSVPAADQAPADDDDADSAPNGGKRPKAKRGIALRPRRAS